MLRGLIGMKLCPSCRHGAKDADDICQECGADLREVPRQEGRQLAGMMVQKRYKLLSFIEEGGMGWIYRGQELGLLSLVAVKLMKSDADDEQMVDRFMREATLAGRLHHPHVVTVLDSGRSGGLPYIICELLDGETLAVLMRREGILPLHRSLNIFNQLLAAVEALHHARVIHRDLKPDNIMLVRTAAGRDFIKVLDFGIAEMQRPRTDPATPSHHVQGTPGYMAPEQIRAERCTEATDLYACGVVLYEMLAGRLPFDGETVQAVLSGHLFDPPPPILPPLPGADLWRAHPALFARLLAKEPGQRFQQVAELRQALFSALPEALLAMLPCRTCHRLACAPKLNWKEEEDDAALRSPMIEAERSESPGQQEPRDPGQTLSQRPLRREQPQAPPDLGSQPTIWPSLGAGLNRRDIALASTEEDMAKGRAPGTGWLDRAHLTMTPRPGQPMPRPGRTTVALVSPHPDPRPPSEPSPDLAHPPPLEPSPGVPEAPSLEPLDLRPSELARATRFLDEPGGVLEVLGPPGSGRTTLLSRLAAEETASRFSILRCQADLLGPDRPWWPIQRLASTCLRLTSRPLEAQDLVSPTLDAGLGAEDLTGLWDLFGLDHGPIDTPSDTRRAEVLAAVIRLILTEPTRSDRPVLLLVDDLDAYDPPSLHAVQTLAPLCDGVHLKLVTASSASLLDAPGIRQVSLGPLPPALLLMAMRARLQDRPPPPPDIELLVAEQARHDLLYFDQALLFFEEGSGWDPAPDPELQVLIGQRLGRLPPGARRVLDLIALLGEPLSPGALARQLEENGLLPNADDPLPWGAASPAMDPAPSTPASPASPASPSSLAMPPPDPPPWMTLGDALVERGYLSWDPEGALVPQTPRLLRLIAQAMGPEAAQTLHAALFTLRRSGQAADPLLAAKHAYASRHPDAASLLEAAGDLVKAQLSPEGAALSFYELAIQACRTTQDLEDSARCVRRLTWKAGEALRVAGHAMAAEELFSRGLKHNSPPDPELRARLLSSHGRLLLAQARSEEARAQFEEAATLAREAHQPSLLVLCLTELLELAAPLPGAQLALLDTWIAELEPEAPKGLFRLFAARSRLHHRRGEGPQALLAARRACEVAHAEGSLLGQAESHYLRGVLLQHDDDLEASALALGQAILAFQNLGDRLGQARCHQVLARQGHASRLFHEARARQLLRQLPWS